MISRKIILILSVFIFIILIVSFVFGCYIFIRQNNNKIPLATECPQKETKPTEENSNAEAAEEWNTYYDERYKYKIDFPSGLNIANIYEHTRTVELSNDLGGGLLTLTTNGGAGFSPTELPGPGIISVEIFENSKFQSLDEWLESEKNEYVSRVVEKRINIDGNDAIVTHQVSMADGKIYEEFKQPKVMTFFKDNTLFIITTSMDCGKSEKVWNSFKFITGDYPIY